MFHGGTVIHAIASHPRVQCIVGVQLIGHLFPLVECMELRAAHMHANSNFYCIISKKSIHLALRPPLHP